MNRVITKTLTNELKFEDTIILTYKIDYPEIQYSDTKKGEYIFNLYNKNKAFELEKYCKTELYNQAKDLYKYNSKNNEPIIIFEIILSFNITYNKNSLISIYSDQYIYAGGAHGSTIRTSQTWDLTAAKKLPLNYFFYDDPYFILEILRKINKQIKKQIKNEEKQYFDNYCELIINNFNPKNYNLYSDYIEIYFEQYDIAPYSSGIPDFKI